MCWRIHSGLCLVYRHTHSHQWAETAAETGLLDISAEIIIRWFQDYNLQEHSNLPSSFCFWSQTLWLKFRPFYPPADFPISMFQVKFCLTDMGAAEKRGIRSSREDGDVGTSCVLGIHLMILCSSHMRCLCLPHLCSLQWWKLDCVDIHFPQKFKGSPGTAQKM